MGEKKKRSVLRKILLGLGIFLLVIIAAAAVFLIPTFWGKPWTVNHFYMRTMLYGVTHSPMLTSKLKILKPFGLTYYEDDLDEMSIAKEQEILQWAKDSLQMLHSYERPEEPGDEQLAYDVMDWFLSDWVRTWEHHLKRYNLGQLSGAHVAIPDFMVTTHSFEDADYAGWYVDRVSQAGRAIDQVIAAAKTRAERGVIPPNFILARIAKDVDKFIADPPEKNPLYTHFLTESQKVADLTPEDRDELAKRLLEEIRQGIYPAWKRLHAAVLELEAKSDDRAGVWKLPGGAEYYADRLRSNTTTDMAPEQVHALGLSKVGEFRAEITGILGEQGYQVTSLGDTLRELIKEERFHFPDTPEGREQALGYNRGMVKEIEEGIKKHFGIWPRTPVEVKPVPEFLIESAPFAYYDPPPMDGSKPGVFYFNFRELDKQPKYMMRTTAYHEAVPGHHTQIAIKMEQKHLPMHMRILPFTAFGEGWALYAESLAGELGYFKDPFERVGYLTMQLVRAVRLVVDTGLHHKRWTRAQAIDYMRENTGLPLVEVDTEVDRYIMWPGQACAYMVGQLKILELRDRAKKALGERFTLKEFHKRLLQNGSLPLSLLEQEIDRWIWELKDKKAASAERPPHSQDRAPVVSE